MTYFLLILFFGSFLGIIFMIGKKLSLVRGGQILEKEEALFEFPHWDNIREIVIKNTKKYGHAGLVEAIRFYVKITNFLKEKYAKMKIKLKNINTKKNSNGNEVEKVEVSSFLKMVSNYKQKIQEIKQTIHEEENN